MYELHRQEGKHGEGGNDEERHHLGELVDHELIDHCIPHRREAAERLLGRLHAGVGEIEGADHRNHDAGAGGIGLRQDITERQHQRRNQNIGREIDHQIEGCPVEPWQPLLDVEPAGDGTVDAVDDHGQAEEEKDHLPRTVGGGHRRHQGEARSACREQMNRPDAEIFPHSPPISHP